MTADGIAYALGALLYIGAILALVDRWTRFGRM